MTNDEVQGLLDDALTVLAHAPQPTDHDQRVRHQLVYHALEQTQRYSASGNSIAGLAGRGLEEALALAEAIVTGKYNLARVQLDFKAIVKAVEAFSDD